MKTDTELLDWLEAQFTGRFRNSVFICNELSRDGQMLNMDFKLDHAVVHRAKTVRGLIALAMEGKEEE